MSIAFEVLAERLRANALELLKAWYPNGRRQGREWCVGSLAGEVGQSLRINIDSTRWADFSDAEIKGGDLISLYAAQHNLSQVEAAQQLSGDFAPLAAAPAANGHDHREDRLTELPPDTAPLALQAFKHPRHGVPAQRYVYRDTEGRALYVVARYEGSEGKSFAPFTWRHGAWRMKAHVKPRPLYGLQRLSSLLRRVIVVEGEKCADALQSVLQLSPVVTWAGGAQSWRHHDWSPLKGRACVLWADADPPGVSAMLGIATLLMSQGCVVHRVDVEGLPDAYDAADAVAAGYQGPALNEWLKPRLKPILDLRDAPQEPQRVRAPETIASHNVTIPGIPETEPPPDETPPLTEKDIPPGYQLAVDFGLKVGRQGPHQNMSNATLMVAGLVQRGKTRAIWWDSFLRQVRTADGEWSDNDTLGLLAKLQYAYDFESLSRGIMDQAIALYAWQHQQNLAQEWLLGLQWDGTSRLKDLLPVGFGTLRGPYMEAVGRCFLMGLVARVLMPGCQVDNLPVFEGPQGLRKSQALRALGGEWHAEVTEQLNTKDFYLTLAGKMLIELSEMKAFRGLDEDTSKAIITRTTDRYRVPYETRPGDHPRACVFCATTNRREWINDPTGGRRFWPVPCGDIDIEWIRVQRPQLFAEAVARVMAVPKTASAAERLAEGAAWWDIPENLALMHQEERQKHDVLAHAIEGWCRTHTDFPTLDVLTFALGLEGAARLDERLQARVKDQLTRWGFDLVSVEGLKVWRRP